MFTSAADEKLLPTKSDGCDVGPATDQLTQDKHGRRLGFVSECITELLGAHLKDKGHCCQEHAGQTHSGGLMSESGHSEGREPPLNRRLAAIYHQCLCINFPDASSSVKGPKLTDFEEQELMQKWQEILGPSNEVMVRCVVRWWGVMAAQQGVTGALPDRWLRWRSSARAAASASAWRPTAGTTTSARSSRKGRSAAVGSSSVGTNCWRRVPLCFSS